MAFCRYCGQDAGWFRKVHGECEEKEQQRLQRRRAALDRISDLALEAIRSGNNPSDLPNTYQTVAADNGLSDPEIREALASGWQRAVDAVLADNLLSLEEEQHLLLSRTILGSTSPRSIATVLSPASQ